MTHSLGRAAARALRLGALGAGLALAAACDDDPTGNDAGDAQIRFVHAAPGAANVNVKWGGTNAFSAVAFGSAAGGGMYKEVAAGSRPAAVRAVDGTADLVAGSVQLGKERDYTIALIKEGSAHALVTLADTNTAPAAGKAKVRVAHLAPLASGNVDVYVTAPDADLAGLTASAAGVQFKKASAYLVVDAGSRRVRVTAAGTKTVLLDAGTLDLAAGRIRTVVAMDPENGVMPLKGLTLVDRNP